MWQALLGGAVSSGNEMFSAAAGQLASMYEARRFNKKARSDWRKSLQRGPTYWRQGLERAGINPIYALGGGSFPGTNLSIQGQTTAGGRPAGGSFAASARAMELMRAEKEKIQEEATAASSAAGVNRSREEQIKQEMDINAANAHMAREYLDHLNSPEGRAMVDAWRRQKIGDEVFRTMPGAVYSTGWNATHNPDGSLKWEGAEEGAPEPRKPRPKRPTGGTMKERMMRNRRRRNR